MKDEQLLAEAEDIMRTMPAVESLHHEADENFSWLGRLAAFIEVWSPPKATFAVRYHWNPKVQPSAFPIIQIRLQETSHSLPPEGKKGCCRRGSDGDAKAGYCQAHSSASRDLRDRSRPEACLKLSFES